MQLSRDEDSSSPSRSAEPHTTASRRDQLVSEGLTLVRFLAHEILQKHRLPIPREDLESCGMRGLLMAADAFDHRPGTLFTTYAYRRIRGAMLDAIRDGHGADTRSESSCRREVERRCDSACATASGDSTTECDTATATRAPTSVEYVDWRARSVAPDLERALEAAPTAEDILQQTLLTERVRAAIAALPIRERRIVELFYYDHDESYEAVAKALGHTRPHIFRIHARARARLRTALAELTP